MESKNLEPKSSTSTGNLNASSSDQISESVDNNTPNNYPVEHSDTPPGANEPPSSASQQVVIVKQEKQRSDTWAVLSLVFALLPAIFAAYLFIMSGGNTSENGAGAIFWLGVLYIPFAIPIFVMSVIFGILGLKTNRRGLAIAGLCIDIVVLVIFFAPSLLPSLRF